MCSRQRVGLSASSITAVGYARFLSDHFALGMHTFGSVLVGRWSQLFMPEIAYCHDRLTARMDNYHTPDGPRTWRQHELRLSGSALPVFRLFEALVLGAGPSVTMHIRLDSHHRAATSAFSEGLTSMLAGSP